MMSDALLGVGNKAQCALDNNALLDLEKNIAKN